MYGFFRLFFSISLLTGGFISTAQVALEHTERAFLKNEIQEDILYLKHKLLEQHPGVFLYTDSAAFNSFFHQLLESVEDTMHEREIFRLVSQTSSLIKDGHTLFFPSFITTKTYNAFELFFPARTYWDDGHLYVYMDYTAEGLLPPGTEILSINGKSAANIIQDCLSRMMRDGDELGYPIWVLNNWFAEYYGYMNGHPQWHEIQVRDSLGVVRQVLIEGVPKPTMLKRREERYPGNDLAPQPGKGIELTFTANNDLAVLTIRDFHNKALRRDYGQFYRSELKAAFRDIEEAGINKLVVDIRGNQGGELRNGNILLRYLLEEPFSMMYGYRKTKQVEQGVPQLKEAHGPFTRISKPMNKYGFDGNLVLLVNGGSFSNSGIVASVLRYSGNGASIVGEPTGGNGVVINGNVELVKLPHSGLQVEIPTLQFLIKNPKQYPLGSVEPDIYIKPTIQQLKKGEDPAMDMVLNLLGVSQTK